MFTSKTFFEPPAVVAATLTARADAIKSLTGDLAIAGVLMGAYGYWARPADGQLMPSIFSLAALTGLVAHVVGLAIACRLRVRAAGLVLQGGPAIDSD